MSIVSYLELAYGAWKSQAVEANLTKIEGLRLLVPVQSLDMPAAEHYGRLRTDLEKKGTPIGAYEATLLRKTYRMNAEIAAFPSRAFYRGRLEAVSPWAERRTPATTTSSPSRR